MTKYNLTWTCLSIVLFLLIMGCAPQSVAPPAPAAPPTVAPSVPSSGGATAATPADAAWGKIEQAARKEGRLVVYDASYFAGDIGRAVTKAFKDKYGISVEFLVTGGSSASIERLRAEKRAGQAVASLVATGSVSGPNLVTLGFLQDMSKELPVLKDRQVFTLEPIYSPGGELITFTYTPFAAGVNTNAVKEGEVQSFYDLLNPRWKGKIIMRDPRLGSGAEMLTITTMRHEKILDDDYFYRLAKQEPVMWGGSSLEGGRKVALGEPPVGFYTSVTTIYAPIIKEGGPLRVVHMKEGSIGMPATVELVKDAPHPNAAKVFANWLLSPEGQRLYHETQATASIRKDLPDFTLAVLRKDPVKKLIPTSWEVALKTNDEVREGVMEKFFGKR